MGQGASASRSQIENNSLQGIGVQDEEARKKKHRRDQVEENNGVCRAPLISFGKDHDAHKLRISHDEVSSINMDGEGKDSYDTEFECMDPDLLDAETARHEQAAAISVNESAPQPKSNPHLFSPLDSSLSEGEKRQTETLEHEASLDFVTSLSRDQSLNTSGLAWSQELCFGL